MQRRMKLIRKLLEYVEMSETEDRLPIPEMENYTEAQVHYHAGLCEEAGYLILYQTAPTSEQRFMGIKRMTWAGHEALDRMREGKTTK